MENNNNLQKSETQYKSKPTSTPTSNNRTTYYWYAGRLRTKRATKFDTIFDNFVLWFYIIFFVLAFLGFLASL